MTKRADKAKAEGVGGAFAEGGSQTIPALVALRDVKRVVEATAAKYDMFVSEDYAADLIAYVDASSQAASSLESDVARLVARIAELEARLAESLADGLLRHMWRIYDGEQSCPKCGKSMALYLEGEGLTPAVWRCTCGHRQIESQATEDVEAMPK